jgi:hypothetical protein
MRTLRLIAAWVLVGLPLAWGVARSVQKSRPLFSAQSSSTNSIPVLPKP